MVDFSDMLSGQSNMRNKIFNLYKSPFRGMEDLLTVRLEKNGKAREHSEPKYKLITNHTARKTFITNSIMPGMNTKTIKEITGHKKDSVFNKYVKISEEFKKLEMERTRDSIPGSSKIERSDDV